MDLKPFEPFLARLATTSLASAVPDLSAAIAQRLAAGTHGDLAEWEAALRALPPLPAGRVRLDQPCVGLFGDQGAPPGPGRGDSASQPSSDPDASDRGCRVGRNGPDQLAGDALDPPLRERLQASLLRLHPWRKGPFCLHGLHLDSEWRADWKWARLADAVSPLTGRVVLDVGCGNGYYLLRMLGAGARLALGVDPTLLYVVQFQAINRYLGRTDAAVLPLRLEDLPTAVSGIDSIFSMGVLYHRRAPLEHLARLFVLLRPGGELVLETLVLEDASERAVLVPPGRYAGMRNLWFIPSPGALRIWLERCGFREVRLVDLNRTSCAEQRTTPWMRFQSLADQLDPLDPGLTREGLPAPLRAILIARRP